MAVASSSAGHKALISYNAPPQFIASPPWQKVHATLINQLPLRNIHWKSAARSSVRTIQELDVNLVPFDPRANETTSQVPVTLLEKPLLHIYILHCEDTDLENYRNLKKHIKDWHTAVTARKNHEWLILHIIKPDPTKQTTRNVFQMKNSVLDKLKTDFNLDKRERISQLNWSTGNDNPLAWAEFVNRMKEGLAFAFDTAIAQRHEEVKRSENQQTMPGWNFCTFFILKESLASSFEGMNLLDEAIIPYDELEGMFYHVSRAKNMSWFGSLIHPNPHHDSPELLDIGKKPYRDMILANSISIFDFRIYLLGRQCRLLAKMGKMSEVTTKVGFFLGVLGKRIRGEAEATLPPLFIESWTYSAALSAVEQCDEWATSFKVDSSKSASANAGKAELLDIARCQLNVIGIEAGHLPDCPPFSASLPEKRLPPGTKIEFTNETLNTAVNDRHAFQELYFALTNRAIDLYAKAGRRKFALKLHGCLAAFEMHRGNLSMALNTFISLPGHYSPHMWTSLEALMLSRALDTYSALEKPQDQEWAHIVLSFLKAYVEHQTEDMLMHNEDKVEYVSQLVKSLRRSIGNMQNDIPHPDHPAFTVTAANIAQLAETRDGSYLDVTMTNHLPCDFPADEIAVVVAGRDGEKFRYVAPIPDGCPPGPSKYTLFCPNPSSGSFVLESSEIRSSHLLLQWNYRKSLKTHKPTLVRVPHDLLALDVQISQSNRIALGSPSSLLVVISTGRNSMMSMTARLTSTSVTFRCKEATLQDDVEAVFSPSHEGIDFKDVPLGTEVSFHVPHSDASALTAMKVNLEVEYTTMSEASIVRTSRFSRVLVTTLPISVNVEDFFRGTRLISKFTVSTTSHQHVRIAEATLDIPPELDGVTVRNAAEKRRVLTVTPLLPANFLFALDSTNGPVRESLTLTIKYRMLREEVESIIHEQVAAVLRENPSLPQNRIILVGKLIDALESDAAWVEMYGITGELVVPDILDEDSDIADLWKLARQLLADHRHPDPPRGQWREIKIPVDVPFMNIVAAARIQILSTPFAKEVADSRQLPLLYAGQPISANLTIHTTFHWGLNPKETNKQYLLRFNVEESIREWLISGPKRGDFVAKDNSTHTVSITLIALHHGEFYLPKIGITALPMAGQVTMGSLAIPSIETYQVHGAERVLVLPRGGRSTFVVSMGGTG